MIKRLFILQFFLVSLIFAKCYDPWFTGPFIAAGGSTNKKGEISFNFTLYYIDTYGSYDKNWEISRSSHVYTVIPNPSIDIGLNSWMDFKISGSINIASSQGIKSTQFRDLSARLGMSLVKEEKDSLIPAIMITFGEIFPTGKFDHLDEHKNFLDASGAGSYKTVFGLYISKVYCFFEKHPIGIFLDADYSFPSKVFINTPNIYTGFETPVNGDVYPGNTFDIIFSFDYSLSQRIAISMDVSYTYVSKTRFQGFRIIRLEPLEPIVPAPVHPLSFPPTLVVSQIDQRETLLTLSPAIEYNFNEHFGFLITYYTTITGKNSPAFRSISGILAITF